MVEATVVGAGRCAVRRSMKMASLFFTLLPESWQAAASDGERWRWLLEKRIDVMPSRRGAVILEWADFLAAEFGVSRLAYYPGFQNWLQNYRPAGDAEEDPEEDGSRFELHTLGENETLAWLAPGPRRISLPDEYNFLKIYRDLAAMDDPYARNAADRVAQVFENRRQYPKAVEVRRAAMERFDRERDTKLEQIVQNWGRFDMSEMQPAGKPARVGFVYRNADGAKFSAQRIRIEKLIADVRGYIEDKPERVDHQQIDLRNIGHRLVSRNQKKYLGDVVAEWELELKPAPNHWDRRVDVETPLTEAGAYLLTANVDGNNLCQTVVWLADTVAVAKQVDKGELYFVADAMSGAPVAGAEVEFFGYFQQNIKNTNRYKMFTRSWKGTTDEQGLLKSAPGEWGDQNNHRHIIQTLVTVREEESGRFAFDGWRHIGYWFFNREYTESKLQDTKCFVATDRPVYRPAQEVKFKAWTRKIGYDRPMDESEYAGKTFRVEVRDPKNEKVFSEDIEADEYGGIDGMFALEDGATLGNYSVHVGWPSGQNVSQIGTIQFRVEEYKKPEFEVVVEAPEDPVALGEMVTAKVKANYYFGAPVASGTVKYTVKRSKHDARWYPTRRWDWLYGNGYWWYSYDHKWHPGWVRWGCWAPIWSWYSWNPDPPEIVIEGEAQLSAEGEATIDIDTASALAIHGDSDHKYEISVTVTDESRRNIDGSGQVLVARDPFRVFAWVDRGFYRVGDTINADFRAQTLDQKGIAGEGELRLLRISHDGDGEVKEEEVAAWDLDPNEDGNAEHRLDCGPGGTVSAFLPGDRWRRSFDGGRLRVRRSWRGIRWRRKIPLQRA